MAMPGPSTTPAISCSNSGSVPRNHSWTGRIASMPLSTSPDSRTNAASGSYSARIRSRSRASSASLKISCIWAGVRGATSPPSGREVRSYHGYAAAVSAPSILVVDDDAPIRRMLERTLVAEGYEVTGVGDGGSALAAVERSAPELILLDVALPGLDGMAVL